MRACFLYVVCIKLLFGHCLQGSGNLDAIQIIKKLGGNLVDSYLDEGTLKHDFFIEDVE